MKLVSIYQCFCDQTRLRILHLLSQGPLCVCHVQVILGETQVKISKHLAYLKGHGLVEAHRECSWMIYQLPAKQSRELQANLACLQDCVGEQAIFRKDSKKLKQLRAKFEKGSPLCLVKPTSRQPESTCISQ